MAYDEGLAERVREIFDAEGEGAERKMFGGVAFFVAGNMACGVLEDSLIVRVGPDNYDDALERPGTRVFDVTGRPMNGWVMVSSETIAEDAMLEEWVDRGVEFAATLPPK